MHKKKSEKTKILFLANCGVSENMLSGGEIRFIEMATAWQEQADIFVMLPIISLKSFKSQGFKGNFIILPSTIFDKLGIIFSYLWRTIFASIIIFTHKKEIIYSTSDFIPDVLPALIIKIFFPSTKWVSVVHHLIPHYKIREGNIISNFISYWAQKISLFLIARFADRIIVISRDFIDKYKFKNVFLSRNGIDLEFISKIEKDSLLETDGVFLGRLNYSKGIFDLLKIWQKVIKKKQMSRLTIIGGGEKKFVDQIKTKISALGLSDNINLYGYLKKQQVFTILKAGKVFVFPSHEEGWGISIAEAMASGLPVICYDLPAYKSIYNNINTIKIDRFNINDFTNRIIDLLANEKMIKKLSTISMSESKQFSWNEIACQDWNYIIK